MQQDRPLSQTTLFKATLLAASTLTVMSGATIAPALPKMEAHFDQVQGVEYLVRLVLTMPALLIVFGGPIAGLLADRIGRKALLVGATVLYGVAGSSGYALSSLGAIIVGRAFLGVAVAGLMTAVTTLIADYYAGAARSQFMGIQAAAMGFGGVIFLSVGGQLADLGWRLPFLIYLAAFAILPFILFVLYEPRANLPTTVQQEITTPVANPQVVDAHGQDALTADRPTQVQPTVINRISKMPRSPSMLIVIYVIAFAYMTIFYMIPVQLPYYLEVLSQASAGQSGLAMALFTLFSSIASLFYGRIKAKLNFAVIIALATVLFGVGYVALGAANSYVQSLAGLAIGGLGAGLIMPNLNVWTTIAAPAEIRGRALGILTAAYFLGQFVSPFVSTPLGNRFGMDITFIAVGIALLLVGVTLGISLSRQTTTITDSGKR
ncbi:major facilitator superfamily MFS_1 [Thalassoporum mexicanum PCC 7367]|uniref:MFS transporter n=1 Tax=Thalassoporum mexicanum TaxID=3457544 RepID=UPI00029FACEF|nr:MFS transporter [Pseudanabaena sp. PCC 7367]AFY70381.1 major facilitator superfamily MFS_1 [Pseudanabaena sp. PCC 7367]